MSELEEQSELGDNVIVSLTINELGEVPVTKRYLTPHSPFTKKIMRDIGKK